MRAGRCNADAVAEECMCATAVSHPANTLCAAPSEPARCRSLSTVVHEQCHPSSETRSDLHVRQRGRGQRLETLWVSSRDWLSPPSPSPSCHARADADPDLSISPALAGPCMHRSAWACHRRGSTQWKELKKTGSFAILGILNLLGTLCLPNHETTSTLRRFKLVCPHDSLRSLGPRSHSAATKH